MAFLGSLPHLGGWKRWGIRKGVLLPFLEGRAKCCAWHFSRRVQKLQQFTTRVEGSCVGQVTRFVCCFVSFLVCCGYSPNCISHNITAGSVDRADSLARNVSLPPATQPCHWQPRQPPWGCRGPGGGVGGWLLVRSDTQKLLVWLQIQEASGGWRGDLELLSFHSVWCRTRKPWDISPGASTFGGDFATDKLSVSYQNLRPWKHRVVSCRTLELEPRTQESTGVPGPKLICRNGCRVPLVTALGLMKGFWIQKITHEAFL